MGNTFCIIRCGKPLTDHKSIEAGMGPVCRLSAKSEGNKGLTGDMFGNADFDYEIVDDILIIFDLDQGGRSLTNDMEYALRKIKKEVSNLDRLKIIYRDSDKVYDGVKINSNCEFCGFYAIQEKSKDLALEKVKRKRK